MKVNVSAHISEQLSQKLMQIAEYEHRSKSYYITKGLTDLLEKKFQDIQDLKSAKETLKKSKEENEKLISFDEVFKGVK